MTDMPRFEEIDWKHRNINADNPNAVSCESYGPPTTPEQRAMMLRLAKFFGAERERLGLPYVFRPWGDDTTETFSPLGLVNAILAE